MVKRKATNDGKEDEGEQMILKYMKKVNRPYSATDIFNNLHGKYSKPSVVRALDSLTDQNELFVKTYGKMQVYAVKQNIEGIKNEDLEGLQKQVTVLEGKMSNMVEDNRKLNHTLSDLKKEPTTENAKALLEKRKRENAQMREHLETLKSGAVLVTPEDRKKNDAEYELYRKEWRTRRKLFRDIFNAVTEHMPGKPAAFMEELGIEEDPVSYEKDTLE
ncbi:Tat binding protein 1-interacting protein-domain-containing protein [Phycomyces blakesleeanus]